MSGRVLLVHFHFPPDGLAGAQITAKFAKYLPEHGWDVWVLTGAERYYTRLDWSTIADVRRWDRVVRTTRLPHPRHALVALRRVAAPGAGAAAAVPAARRSALHRTLASLATTPDDLTGWLPVAIPVGLRLVRRRRIDRLFSSGPPWTNHLAAYALARLTGTPWVACFEDPWTAFKATVARDTASPLSLAIERRLERAVVRRADAVVCLNDVHRDAMVADFPEVPETRFVIIPNGFDPSDFERAAPGAPPTDRLVVTHTGTLYYNRTPRHLFAAVRLLLDRGVVRERDIELRFLGERLGGAATELERAIAAEGVRSVVRVEDAAPRSAAIHAMQASHLLLVLAHDWVAQVPAKTYQYLRAGRPILALAPEGATADLVRRAGGAVVAPTDVEAIAAHLVRAVTRLRAGAPPVGADPRFVARFDRRRLTGMLAALLDRVGAPAVTGAATAEVA